VPTTALHHVEHGTGTPVLALHGWELDHRLVEECLEPVLAARAGYRRIYPDLPGMGATPAAQVAGSDDVLASVRLFVDEQIGERRFLLAGQSYGGYLARALVDALGDQVLGLALICPLVVPETEARTLPEHQVLRAEPGALDGVEPSLTAGFAQIAVVQTAATLRRYVDEVLPGVSAADEVALARIRPAYRLTRDPDGPGARPFAGPSLVLTGRQDASVGYLDQLALLPRLPRATFAVLDVAGHNLQIEQPELFDALLGEWLDRVAAETDPSYALDA
jgi:pimeloyl-ACP methyl ester carboxylesterase